MKRLLLAFLATGLTMSGIAQTDTTGNSTDTLVSVTVTTDTSGTGRTDTIKIGGMVIIKSDDGDGDKRNRVTISNNRNRRQASNANVQTNWWVIDLGFANLNDNTIYGTGEAAAFAPGMDKDDFKLRTGKSVNVNIWLFMQKLNVIKHVVNLKYGLGVELNNYRFDDETIRFQENPTLVVHEPKWEGIKKNKLAADYVTVPLLLNVNFTPKREKGFGLSAGVSAGYLYSSRQKIKENGDKDKFHDDFDLNKFKLAYIGELSLGVVKLYGSYAMKSMWDKGLDQTPYSIGIRFGRF